MIWMVIQVRSLVQIRRAGMGVLMGGVEAVSVSGRIGLRSLE